MSVTLHITNGDITTNILKQSNIEGEIITWREMLCEGKTITDVGSEEFWKTRFDYLKKSYKLTKKNFIDYTLKEYRNLCQQKQQDEIVLWFDNDLFCQINLLALISWLKRFRSDRKITLIQAENKKQKQINDLSKEELQNIFNAREELSKDDIEYGDYIWQLYCSDTPLRLETAHRFNQNSPLQNIEKAIRAHLLRFPSIQNGLNYIENNILSVASAQSFESKDEFALELLKNQKEYGFSDTQYHAKMDNLKKLFTSFNPVKISKMGKKVLENQINYYGKIRSDFAYLGGAKKYSYLYINADEKLLKITS